MSGDAPIRLSLQVFEDDDPQLVARLRALPKSRLRRRDHLLRLLRLGVAAEANGEGGTILSSAITAPRQPEPTTPSAIPQMGTADANAAPSHSPGEGRQHAFNTVLDPDDLAAVFGAPTPHVNGA